MNKRIRRTLEMGSRALAFTRANPDESAGYVAALRLYRWTKDKRDYSLGRPVNEGSF